MHGTTLLIFVLSIHRVVAVQLWQFIITVVGPFDLAVDRGGRTTQIVGDLFDWSLRFKPFSQLAAFFEVQVRVATSYWSAPCKVLF